MHTPSLELGIVGNGNFGGLIDRYGRMVWACLPAFDAEPSFCALLGPHVSDSGYFDVALEEFAGAEQRYLENSAVLVTELRDLNGAVLEILDFAPRYRMHDRMFHPVMLIRRIRLVGGAPRVRIRLRPLTGWGSRQPERTCGSNHIRYLLDDFTLRATTDVPLPALHDGHPLIVDRDMHIVLTSDESLPHSIGVFVREQLDRTLSYWHGWVRNLAVPVDWQTAVIRAAITLKLCQDESSGAIVSGMTTSVATPGIERTPRDARCSWLGDAAHVVRTFNRLGATRSMEENLRFVFNAASDPGVLRPVYGVQYATQTAQHEITSLAGYRGLGKVITGVDGARVRNDTFGAVVLATAQLFYDRRLERAGNLDLFARLQPLAVAARRAFDEPDAGWWIDERTALRTSTGVMCFVAADRLARIAGRLGLDERAAHWAHSARHMRDTLIDRAWSETENALLEEPGVLDPTALRFANLGFIRADDPRFAATVDAIAARLSKGSFIVRRNAYPLAPVVCSYWYVDALGALGRRDEGRELFELLLSRRTRLGLHAEYVDPANGAHWGNFPSTQALVGLIGAALRLSRPWEDVI